MSLVLGSGRTHPSVSQGAKISKFSQNVPYNEREVVPMARDSLHEKMKGIKGWVLAEER